jgi:hypothetical protein
VTGLCLAVAAVIRATLPTSEFTLAWTHSVEKVQWAEDYRIAGDTLVAASARVRGSGAGMEPPADARLVDGVWHYRPATQELQQLRVTVSPYTADYVVCWNGECASVAELVGMRSETGVVELFACPRDADALPSSVAVGPR